MFEKLLLIAMLITGTTVIACAISSPEAKGDAPPVPACVFEREPVAIFCSGIHGSSCFVCYKNNGDTECWPFDRSRCMH